MLFHRAAKKINLYWGKRLFFVIFCFRVQWQTENPSEITMQKMFVNVPTSQFPVVVAYPRKILITWR